MGIGGGCALVIYSKFVWLSSEDSFVSLGNIVKLSVSSNVKLLLSIPIEKSIWKKTISLSSVEFHDHPLPNLDCQSPLGPLSIATPGELLAYREAYLRFGGGVTWSALFAPAIRLCEKGFNVSRALAHAIKKNEKFILNDTQLRYETDRSSKEFSFFVFCLGKYL